MSRISFTLCDANQRQKAQQVTFSLAENPLVSDLAAAVSKEIGLTPESSETLRFYNQTRERELVEGPVAEQVAENETVVYKTDAFAG